MMGGAAPSCVRRPGALIAFVLGLAFLAAALPVRATAGSYPGLVDGLEIISAYRDLDPEAEAAYKALMERVPPEVRQQASDSTWAQKQTEMTAADLEAAAFDPQMHIVRTPSGLAVISGEKLSQAIDGLAEFAFDQEDLGQILDRVTRQLPSQLRPLAETVASALAATRQLGPLARGLGVAGLSRQVKAEITARIDPVSQAIRDSIGRDGADGVLTTARSEAKLAADEKASQRPEASGRDAQPAPTGRDGEQADGDRSLAEGIRKIIEEHRSALQAIERRAATLEQTASQCMSRRAAASVATDTIASTHMQLRKLSDEARDGALVQLQRMNAAKAELAASRRSAEAMCQPDTSRAGPDAMKELDAMSVRWTTEHRAIPLQVTAGLDSLFETPVPSCSSAESAVTEFLDVICPPLRDPASIGLASDGVSEAFAVLRSALREARRSGVDALNYDLAVLDVRVTSLESRMAAAVNAIQECLLQCSELKQRVDGIALNQCDRMAGVVEERRAAARSRLSEMAAELEPDRAALLAALERARSCLTTPGEDDAVEAQTARAEAALEACRFGEARSLIDTLPRTSRRESLVQRWNNKYEDEKRARVLLAEAATLREAKKPEQALARLREAPRQDLCPPTASAIATAIAAAEKAVSEPGRAENLPSADMSTSQPTPPSGGIERIAAATASCIENSGPGHRAGLETPDGRFWCVPDQAAADRRCRETMGDVEAVAFGIKEDGTFQCRLTQAGAEAACARATPGWHASKLLPDSSYECYPGQAARTAQCARDHGARGWRAGKLRRRSGGGFVWDCHPPAGEAGRSPRITTPRACPPGSFLTSTGQCLNAGAIVEGLRQPPHARPQPSVPAAQLGKESHPRPPSVQQRPQSASQARPRCAWKTWAGRRQCMCVLPNDPTVERGMDASYCR